MGEECWWRGDDSANGIALDSAGNCYVTGFFSAIATFGSTSLSNKGRIDIFVAKYTSAGELLWVQQAGGPVGDTVAGQANGIAVDTSGNCFVTGSVGSGGVGGPVKFGTLMLTNVSNGQAFVAKYSDSGALLWVRAVGGGNSDYGRAISVSTQGEVFVTGEFYGTALFDTTNHAYRVVTLSQRA